ncbi:hypothetical protein BDR26DRAFT_851418 [Obelidium mucronatum]|nr:hypothetical protein BDR26DRAFT_851418 [Obelidium mucronatum]
MSSPPLAHTTARKTRPSLFQSRERCSDDSDPCSSNDEVTRDWHHQYSHTMSRDKDLSEKELNNNKTKDEMKCCLKPGSGVKPYVANCNAPRSSETTDFDVLEFDDFLDDLISSVETSVQTFLCGADLFTLFGFYSGISLVDVINPSPLRSDWIAFCLISVKVLHRSMRASIFMIAVLLLFFSISNTLILAMFGLPYAPQILSTVTSMVIYCHIAFCMGPQKRSSWGIASLFVMADALLKQPATSDKQFLSGAHCISYALYSAISKFLEAFGKRDEKAKSPDGIHSSQDEEKVPVELQLEGVSADQCILSWRLPGYTLSELCTPTTNNSELLKSRFGSDILGPNSKQTRFGTSSSRTTASELYHRLKKSSKVPSDWDCLIFRGVPPSNSILGVTVSDVKVKVNGKVASKSDFTINVRNRTVVLKVTPCDELEISVAVAGLESEIIRVVTPKRIPIEKQRKGVLSSKTPVYRSIGVLAVTSSENEATKQTTPSEAALDESDAVISANCVIISELTKDLESLQAHYKASQANLRRIRREYTRAACNLKSEIELAENHITKDISIEHKTRQKFQTLQDCISDTESKINLAMSEIKSISTTKIAIQETELKPRQQEISSLKETLKGVEKSYNKLTSQMAKTTTISLAEVTALRKILEDSQKELRVADAEVLNLKSTELMRVESQVDTAWSRQTEMKERSEQHLKQRQATIDELKAALEKLRAQCENLEKMIKEKRSRNDKICEELMIYEDNLLKADESPSNALFKSSQKLGESETLYDHEWASQNFLDDDYNPYSPSNNHFANELH